MNRILIVDDERHIREGIAARVEQCGDDSMLVSGMASNGAEALEWLAAHHADICLSDIRMPVMDGLELIQAIEQKYPWMQCIIISSYDDFDYAKQAIRLGVTDYILKPVEREMLEKSIENAAAQVEKKRLDQAFHMLASNLEPSQALMNRWKDLILTRQFDKYPLLVVETLRMMEDWIQGQYYLFDALSTAWIEMVANEVKLAEPERTAVLDKELGYEEKALTADTIRFYYRLNAVMRLEKGILHLFERIKSGPHQENVKFVSQIKQYIEQHYAEKINLEELADLIPISRSYLTILFKQRTGQTIWAYLVDVRMKNAKILLIDQKLKIYEIANRVGYENSEHFSKLFKEYFGVTPKEYRRMVEMNVE